MIEVTSMGYDQNTNQTEVHVTGNDEKSYVIDGCLEYGESEMVSQDSLREVPYWDR